MMPTPHGPADVSTVMDRPRRGNYDSGDDFVLEYGELRFTFNERDFAERCEQAARKLGFVGRPARRRGARGPRQPRRQRRGPRPRLRPRRARQRLLARARRPADRSLVHWLRRLIFRCAWLDQRVKEGELDVAFDEHTHTSATSSPTATTSRSSSRPSPPGAGSPTSAALSRRAHCERRALRLRARLGDRLRAGLADEQLRPQRAAGDEVERREAARRRSSARVERDDRRLAAERRRARSR